MSVSLSWDVEDQAVQQILEQVVGLTRESLVSLARFEPVSGEDWESDKCLYRLQAHGGYSAITKLCESLENAGPTFEVEELTLHGDPSHAVEGIGVEILLQICGEHSDETKVTSGI